MYGLAEYETAIDRQQMIRLLTNHPELEAEIISVWEKPQNRLFFADDERKAVGETIRLIEEKYGYDPGPTVSGRAVWLFWGASAGGRNRKVGAEGFPDRQDTVQ